MRKKKRETYQLEQFARLPSVISAGLCVFDPIWGQKFHTSPGMEILFILKGAVRLQYGGKSFPGKAGDILCVPSGTPHLDDFDIEKPLEVFMIQLEWKAEKLFWSHFDNSAAGGFSVLGRSETARAMENIRSALGEGSSEEERLILSSRCLTLLLLLMKFGREARAGGDAARKEVRSAAKHRFTMLQAKKYMDDHYSEMISLDGMADALGISPYYLSHIFSRESNFSLFSYLSKLRMEKAKLLLSEGAMNVSEVAEAVGYESGSYFSRVFKKHFGHPPKQHIIRGGRARV